MLRKRQPAPPPERVACPGCGLKVLTNDLWRQRHHMETDHPELIAERLESAGFEQDQSGQWVDTLAHDG